MIRPSSDRIPAVPAVGELTRPATRVDAEAHLAAAAYLLHRSGDGALVVTADGTGDPVALLSATDVSRAVAAGRDLESTRAHHVTGPSRTVEADLPARDAARVMLWHGVMQLPACSGDRVLGFADLADVCRAVLASEETAVRPHRPAAGPPAP